MSYSVKREYTSTGRRLCSSLVFNSSLLSSISAQFKKSELMRTAFNLLQHLVNTLQRNLYPGWPAVQLVTKFINCFFQKMDMEQKRNQAAVTSCNAVYSNRFQIPLQVCI